MGTTVDRSVEVIHKFKVPITDTFDLDLPDGAEVLCVQVQNGEPYFWVKLNPERQTKVRRFAVHGTGHQVYADVTSYIGTFQVQPGFVGHVFERRVW